MTLTGTGHPQERRFVLSAWRQPGISAALALCLLMISLAACQPAVQEPDLVGVWTDRGRVTYLKFDTDGTWVVADTFELLSARPLGFGTYHLEGKLLTFETDEKSGSCRGATAAYEVEQSEQEELTFTLADDPCSGRVRDLVRGPWERFSP
ncbi:MAG: hypothetical protein O6949_00210 [Chloroflexi bacterium]|nr:hypothetical protein [Chloroflexota bacterium]